MQIDMPEDLPEMPSIESALARPDNLYFEQMSNISAPDLIKRFAETAPPEVWRFTVAQSIWLVEGPPRIGEGTHLTTPVAGGLYSPPTPRYEPSATAGTGSSVVGLARAGQWESSAVT